MIINHKHKFAFVHIPKTGGTSLTLLLAPHLDKPPARTKGRSWQGLCHNTGLHSGINKHTADKLKDYFKFTIVRNPYDRLLSMWRSGYGRPGKKTFEEYCNSVCSRRKHRAFGPQVDYISHDGIVLVDYVARYEQYDAEVTLLMNKWDLSFEQIPHRLNTKNRKNRQAVFTKKIADKIYEHMKLDFDTFSYKKDSWKDLTDGNRLFVDG